MTKHPSSQTGRILFLVLRGLVFITCIICDSFNSAAQNLISNGGFEYVPENNTQVYSIVPFNWNYILSVDLHSDSIETIRVFGIKTKKANSGHNFIGLSVYSDYSPNYREYAITKLLTDLKKGYRYRIGLYYKFYEHSSFFSEALNMFFLSKYDPAKNKLVYRDTLNSRNVFHDQTYNLNEWNNYVDTIIATGEEKYLGIGNLALDDQMEIKKRRRNFNCPDIYFFLDNVTVVLIDSAIMNPSLMDKTVKAEADTFKLNSVYTISNINFEFDQANLEKKVYPLLQNLADHLVKHNYKVSISGYTDSLGNEDYNLQLSKRRAENVANYLILNGVKSENISFDGFGPSKPLASNKTEQGREENRRVEFVIKANN